MQTKDNDQERLSGRVRRGRAKLVGLGLDGDDGHVRCTAGDSFALYGGSERIHCEMQRRALRIREEIERLGIRLDHMTYDQYERIRDIVDRENETAMELLNGE